MLRCDVSSEVVLQGMAKNDPTEKKMDTEIQAKLKHAPAWKLTEGRSKVYRYKFQR